MNNNYRALETFREGDIVDIANVTEFQQAEILKINDSGVNVKLRGGLQTTLSRNSPAILTSENIKAVKESIVTPKVVAISDEEKLLAAMKQLEAAKEQLSNSKNGNIVIPITTSNSIMPKSKLENPQIPTPPFTIKQFCELNNIAQPVGYLWVKQNCTEAGKAPKPEGQRGKTATLYTKN